MTADAPYYPHSKPIKPCLLKGASLVEVLVAVLILSIGLLGIAGLQLSAIRYNHSASLRSLANLQAHNMMDRMRANRLGVLSGAYDNASGIPSLPSCNTLCSTNQIAARDIHIWNTGNALLLPSGQGSVTRSNQILSVSISWQNDKEGTLATLLLSSAL